MTAQSFGFRLLGVALASTVALLGARADDAEKVGERPYEMVWAHRDAETRAPIVDFENLDGWRVETTNSVANFERSREEQMYGEYVGKLTYRRADKNGAAPSVAIRAPEPIPVPNDADAYSCWIVGNNWGWTTDPTTPRVRVFALVQNADGEEFALPLETVDWKEWFLCYRIIPQDVRTKLGDAPRFAGFRVDGGANDEDRTLFFDSLCVFKEEREPLEIGLRAKPGVELFEGQPLGVNAGEGRLPFPTNEDTIIPDSSEKIRTPMFHFYGDSCDFVYTGEDGELVYVYKPKTGTWTDFGATWNGCDPFLPLDGGGVRKLVGDDGAEELVDKAELLEFKSTDEGALAKWRLTSKTATADVEYRMQIKGKSLVVDTIAKGGRVPSVEFGRIRDAHAPRVISVPYLLYDYGKRPGIAYLHLNNNFTQTKTNPLKTEEVFASGMIDWYRSGASYLRGAHGIEETPLERKSDLNLASELLLGPLFSPITKGGVPKVAIVNGGAEYRPKTDGTRNDVYERFIFTVSPTFEETLPNIPNPASPYREIAGKGVWRSHGATTRDADKKYWRDVWRRGMRHMIVTDHEVCWRDGGESFTFRTKPAPKKGGDEGWFDYARFMQDELGFVYGPYNNFTDFAPVNEYWSPDMISRASDWSLQRAWMRCYAPKPTRAVEFCEKLTPINEEKFHFSCAYCDVHSSVPPWTRTDYDERTPGAGTFMSVYYPYGEIFLLQKKAWDGPTYSEGPHHFVYAGLVDGNYAQDQPYNMFKNQWLVDFDLRKMHDLEVDFGMGNPGMFAPGYHPETEEDKDNFVDRFLTATLAFGHAGFYVADYGPRRAARSYFMIQQIASRYTQASVDSINYGVAPGSWFSVSDALKKDYVKNNLLSVRYKNGTNVVVNGSTTPTKISVDFRGRTASLGPNEYVAWTDDGEVIVESHCSNTGRRYDYCESPEYIYLDGRGNWVERPRACGADAGVCRIVSENEFEFIPYDGAELGFKIAEDSEIVKATALDYDMKELGAATVKRSRGYVFVEPVEGAFSYRVVKRKPSEGESAPILARCNRFIVHPGEILDLYAGDASRKWVAPKLNDEFQTATFQETLSTTDNSTLWRAPTSSFKHVWTEFASGIFVDFLVVPLSRDYEFQLRNEKGWQLIAVDRSYKSYQNRSRTLKIEDPRQEGREVLLAQLPSVGDDPTTYELAVYEIECDVVERHKEANVFFTPNLKIMTQRRGEEPTEKLDGTGAMFAKLDASCGGVVKKATKLHPPYVGGSTGQTFVVNNAIIGIDSKANLRISVGKQDGSDTGDGILFQIVAFVNGSSEGQVLAETRVVEHEWQELVVDLAPFAGKTVYLQFVADAGENPNGDWAVFSEPIFESQETELVREIKSVKLVRRERQKADSAKEFMSLEGVERVEP